MRYRRRGCERCARRAALRCVAVRRSVRQSAVPGVGSGRWPGDRCLCVRSGLASQRLRRAPPPHFHLVARSSREGPEQWRRVVVAYGGGGLLGIRALQSGRRGGCIRCSPWRAARMARRVPSRPPPRRWGRRRAPRARETVAARGAGMSQVGASGSGVVSRARYSGSVDVWSRRCEKRRKPRFVWTGEVSPRWWVTLRLTGKVRKEAGDVGMMPCGS